MRAAPPAQAPSDGAGFWQFAQCTLHGLAAGSLVGWLASAWLGSGAAAAALGLTGALTAGAAAAWFIRPSPCRLVWDGAAWSLHRAAVPVLPGRPEVMMAFAGWMLLRFTPSPGSGRAAWLSLTRREAGAHWHGLCAAVYAGHAPAPAGQQRTPAAPGRDE
jgi:hypothetical protein